MKTYLTMIAAGILLVVAALVAFASQQKRDALDEGPSTNATLVLVDVTGPLSANHQAWLMPRIRKVGEDLERGDRLWLYVLSGQSRSPYEIGSFTSPGRGRDAHLLTEGSQCLEKRFEVEVLQKLDSLMVAMAERDSSRESAIAEALWLLTHHSEYARLTGPRKLVLVSDLLENTPQLSFYADGKQSFFTRAGDLRDPAWSANLTGTSVEVFCLLRPQDASRQGPRLFEEWTRYLTYCGAEPTFSAVAP